jgi:hypothetical protein
LDVNYVGTVIEATFDVADQKMGSFKQNGLAMSIPVDFLTGTPRGRVAFQDADAHFS